MFCLHISIAGMICDELSTKERRKWPRDGQDTAFAARAYRSILATLFGAMTRRRSYRCEYTSLTHRRCIFVAQFNVNRNNNTTYVGQRRILAKIRASPCHHHRSQLRASRASSVLLLRATAHNFRCTVATTPNLICASRSLM